MNNTLVQKGRFKQVTYTIDDTGLMYWKKTRESELELHFSFEQLRTNKAKEVENNKPLLICAVLTAFISVFLFAVSFTNSTIKSSAIIFWAAMSIFLFTLYFGTRTRKTYIYTAENKMVEFYSDRPNEIEVSSFLDQLFQERNIYLVSRYGNLSRNLEYAPQLENLNWLLNTKAISKQAYDEKVKELEALFHINQNNSQIGFAKHNQTN